MRRSIPSSGPLVADELAHIIPALWQRAGESWTYTMGQKLEAMIQKLPGTLV